MILASRRLRSSGRRLNRKCTAQIAFTTIPLTDAGTNSSIRNSDGQPNEYVLLVDDRSENLYALEALLEDLQVGLVSARSGDEALACMEGRDFALVLLDVQMPGLSGIDTARLIRERESSASTPIIFLTAGELSESEGVQQAYAMGAVDYLVKPVAPDVLRAKVEVFVELARARERVRRAADEHIELVQAQAAARALAEANTRIEEAAERTRLLFAVSATLAQALTPSEVAATVTANMVRSVGASAAAVVLLERERGIGEIIGFAGYDAKLLAAYQRMPLDAVLPAMEVLRTGQPLWFDTLDELAARYPVLDAQHSLRHQPANAFLPLVIEGRTLGALALGFAQKREFDATLRDLLIAMAQQCASALERARLYDDAEVARAEAETARRDAEEANQVKSDFLATMSHELRTPINAIIGYGDLLDLGITGPVTDAQRHQLGRMRDSADHLLGLVNEILDFSKIESGAMAVAREQIRGTGAADTALTFVRPQAAAKDITISERLSADDVAAYVGDEGRVRQILANLLSNAIKFTDRGGAVTIECTTGDARPFETRLKGGPWICFTVRDTGVGIPRQKLGSIFEPFVQGETGRTRTRSGTGLGLSISRRLARLMGGDLTVESELGQGSDFTLWLPAAAGGVPTIEDNATLPAPSSADTRSGTEDGGGLKRIGALMLDDLSTILGRYRERLRGERSIPSIGALDDAQLDNHVATFLTDIVQSLGVIEHLGEASDLMRDGTEIQRLISERHGAQRHALGWSEEDVVREFEVLADEITRALDRRLGTDAPKYDTALAVLRRFIEQGSRISRRGYRAAEATAAP